jgi:hypothetical protein
MMLRDPQKRVLSFGVGLNDGEHRALCELSDQKVLVIASHGLTEDEAQLVALGLEHGLQYASPDEIEGIEADDLVLQVTVPGLGSHESELVASGVYHGLQLAGQGYWLDTAHAATLH